MKPWSDLSKKQRDNLYNKYLQDTRPASTVIAELAKSMKMEPLTLSRRLREHRQYFKETEIKMIKPALGSARGMLGRNEVRVLANPTDAHGVYADPYAWELALKCIQSMRPNEITWGNDAMDLGVISSFSKSGSLPTVKQELEDEKRKRKELVSAAPEATIWWLSDNHVAERYMNYIFNRAPDLAELDELKLNYLLGIEPDKMIETFEAGNTLRVIHGRIAKGAPGASVLWHMMDDPANRRGRFIRSVMMGHVHRFAHISLDNGLEGLECGCLQNLRPDYMKNKRMDSNWTHGMGFARYSNDWSQIIPARFSVIRNRLVCRLDGQELSVKIGRTYSGLI